MEELPQTFVYTFLDMLKARRREIKEHTLYNTDGTLPKAANVRTDEQKAALLRGYQAYCSLSTVATWAEAESYRKPKGLRSYADAERLLESGLVPCTYALPSKSAGDSSSSSSSSSRKRRYSMTRLDDAKRARLRQQLCDALEAVRARGYWTVRQASERMREKSSAMQETTSTAANTTTAAIAEEDSNSNSGSAVHSLPPLKQWQSPIDIFAEDSSLWDDELDVEGGVACNAPTAQELRNAEANFKLQLEDEDDDDVQLLMCHETMADRVDRQLVRGKLLVAGDEEEEEEEEEDSNAGPPHSVITIDDDDDDDESSSDTVDYSDWEELEENEAVAQLLEAEDALRSCRIRMAKAAARVWHARRKLDELKERRDYCVEAEANAARLCREQMRIMDALHPL